MLRNRAKKLQAKKGFSVLEVLSCLSFLTIALTAGYIHTASMFDFTKLKRNSQNLANELEKLFNRADLLEHAVSIVFTTNTWKVFIESKNKDLLSHHELSAGVRFSKLPSNSEIKISKSGVFTPALIELKSKERKCTITIALRGRVTLAC